MEKQILCSKEIIKRIDYFREKKGMSAYKLGMLLGHAKTYYYRIQNNEIQLSMEGFLEILEILDVSLIEFASPNNYLENQEFLKLFTNLSKENKLVITELMKKLN